MLHLSKILPTALLATVALAPAAGAAVVPRQALLEGTTWNEFDQVNASTATLTLDRTHAYQGTQAAKAVFNGGANGYSRGIYNVNWADGDEVTYAAAFYLPVGFKSKMQGQVDLLRWDNYTVDPTHTDRSGIIVYNSDKKARIMRQKLGVEEVPIAPAFDIPEGRWFWLEVHQRLSKGAGALSEVFLDGQQVATSTQPNTYGRGVTRVRSGIVAIDAARQANPLTLWFDRATVDTRLVGPLGASTPPPAPADTTPPQTTITSAPASGTATSASATFTADEAGATFSCRLDAGAWSACTSPATFGGLAVGTHTLEVRATDAAGNTDATPATASWEVRAAEVEKGRGAATSASSSWSSSYDPQRAVDGSAGTRWSSKALDGQWWRADLGRARSVAAVQVDWEKAYASTYAVETSLDGQAWSLAANASAAGAGTVTTRFAARSARYVRIRSLSRATSYGVSFWETRILGPAD